MTWRASGKSTSTTTNSSRSAGSTACGSRRYSARPLAARCAPIVDIDLLVEFLPQAEIGLIDYAGLMLDLGSLLGRKVDLVSKRGLKPLIRPSVLSEAQTLYAA